MDGIMIEDLESDWGTILAGTPVVVSLIVGIDAWIVWEGHEVMTDISMIALLEEEQND